MIKKLSTHTTGVLLIILSAIVFSLAGVFTKGVSTGAWEVIFWRGVFAIAFTVFYVAWRKRIKLEFFEMGISGLAAAAIGAAATACFISAFKFTTIANVIVIYAASPIIAAVLAWIWVGERMTRKMVIACVVVIVGVGIIVQESMGGINLTGDLLALGMTIGMAIMMVIYRRWPKTPAAGPMALSSIILLVPGVLLSDVFAVPLTDFIILVTFGLTFAIASVTLAEGLKRVPAGEAALLSILETPLAPILGFLFFAEIPALATFIGGGLILAAVVTTQMSKS